MGARMEMLRTMPVEASEYGGAKGWSTMWRMPPVKVRSGIRTLDLKSIPVPML